MTGPAAFADFASAVAVPVVADALEPDRAVAVCADTLVNAILAANNAMAATGRWPVAIDEVQASLDPGLVGDVRATLRSAAGPQLTEVARLVAGHWLARTDRGWIDTPDIRDMQAAAVGVGVLLRVEAPALVRRWVEGGARGR